MKNLAKRTFSLLLAVLMVLSLIPATSHVHAEETTPPSGETTTPEVTTPQNPGDVVWQYAKSNETEDYSWLNGAVTSPTNTVIYKGWDNYDWVVTLAPTKTGATVKVDATVVDHNGVQVGSIADKEVEVSKGPATTTILTAGDLSMSKKTIGDFLVTAKIKYTSTKSETEAVSEETNEGTTGETTTTTIAEVQFVVGRRNGDTGTTAVEYLATYEWINGAFTARDADKSYVGVQPYDWSFSIAPGKSSATVAVNATVVDERGNVVATAEKSDVKCGKGVPTTILSASELTDLTIDKFGKFAVTCIVTMGGKQYVGIYGTFERVDGEWDPPVDDNPPTFSPAENWEACGLPPAVTISNNSEEAKQYDVTITITKPDGSQVSMTKKGTVKTGEENTNVLVTSNQMRNVITVRNAVYTLTITGTTSFVDHKDTEVNVTRTFTWTDHNYATEVEGTKTPATCMATGKVTMKCACGAETEVTLEKNAANHTGNNHIEGKVDATCSANGYTGDTVCECGVKLATGTAIPATNNHNYATEVEGTKTPATCMATGKVTMKCACGATTEVTLPIDAANHTRNNTVVTGAVAATCGAAGYTGDTYCECGVKIATGEAIPATGNHNYATEVEGTKVLPTCVATGKVTKQCACGATTEVTLEKDAAAHTGNNTVTGRVEASCNAAGYTGDTVCECGVKLATGEAIPATGNHNYVTEVEGTKTAATCMATGKVTKACGCGATVEVTLEKDAANHTGNNTVTGAVAATCGAAGYTGDTYCECGAKIATGEAIPATGNHNYATEVEGTKVLPTCVATGKVTKQCACGATTEVTLEKDAAAHTGNNTVTGKVEVSCGENGYTGDTYCECGVKIATGETITATGEHNYATEVEGTKTAATCMATGKVTKACGCGATIEVTLEKDAANHTGNNTVTGKVDATCSAAGYTGDTYCECGAKVATGEVVPATAHTEVTLEGKAATCTEAGLTEGKKCSVCNTVTVAQTEIPALNHNFENGTCTNCGAQDGQQAGMLGDADGNGKVNLRDAILVLKSVNGGATVDVAVADVDGNGKVNLRDAILVLKAANGNPFPTK